MHAPNLLITLIVTTIVLLSYYVYLHRLNHNKNISDILNNNKPHLLGCLFLLSIFIVCYEYHRNCMYSMLCMMMLLIGLCGVIIFPEYHHRDHYSSAILIMLGALLFMKTNSIHPVLILSLCIQFILFSIFIKQRLIEKNKEIMVTELLLISNLVFFYVYLHCLKYC